MKDGKSRDLQSLMSPPGILIELVRLPNLLEYVKWMCMNLNYHTQLIYCPQVTLQLQYYCQLTTSKATSYNSSLSYHHNQSKTTGQVSKCTSHRLEHVYTFNQAIKYKTPLAISLRSAMFNKFYYAVRILLTFSGILLGKWVSNDAYKGPKDYFIDPVARCASCNDSYMVFLR